MTDKRTEERTETHVCDYISRQAVELRINEFLTNETYTEGMLRDDIHNLPSAQPEIIRCKDCKYYVKDHGWNCIEYTVCSILPLHHPPRKPNDFCSRAERRIDDFQ